MSPRSNRDESLFTSKVALDAFEEARHPTSILRRRFKETDTALAAVGSLTLGLWILTVGSLLANADTQHALRPISGTLFDWMFLASAPCAVGLMVLLFITHRSHWTLRMALDLQANKRLLTEKLSAVDDSEAS
jgi:hypothetical protein